ncbi:hypothetical protein HYT56_01225 [Candidatus Woesearchaeota archaeon]|nr:hypothetical protein [Candidatus Woesearchaeota archaeon]
MQKKKKILNREAYYTDKDITPEKMKEVQRMFKDVDHIRMPISGTQLLEKIRREHKITTLEF